jgi:enoyl-CoA hydratase/3-hydroxyacyl-CoA dehydrogenase
MQVGADVGMHVGANFVDSFPERVVKSHMIPLLNESGRLGEKTGKGFYKYEKRKQMQDPEFVQPMLKKSQQMAGLGEVRSSSPRILRYVGCRSII